MNRSQWVLIGVVSINALLMILFAPYQSLSPWRGALPSFDAYYFIFDRHFQKVLDSNLLFLQLGWLALNMGCGVLLLQNHDPKRAFLSRRSAVILIAGLNLILIALFPPFESYSSVSKVFNGYFDGFYFAFGDKAHRAFYRPMLYMEVLIVLVNACVLWLLYRDES